MTKREDTVGLLDSDSASSGGSRTFDDPSKDLDAPPKPQTENVIVGDNVEDYKEKLGARMMFICSFTTMGGVTFGYDIGIIGGVIVMDDFRDAMNLPRRMGDDDDEDTASKLGIVVAILSLGCFIGSVAAGRLADSFGRKPVTISGALTATSGAILQAMSVNLPIMYSGRFVTGLGVGALSSVVPLYNAEVAPKRLRGLLVSLQQLAITFGILAAFLINFWLDGVDASWRLSLWLQCIASGLLMLGAPFLPESPRWLIAHGYECKAATIARRIRPKIPQHLLEAELEDIKQVSIVEKASNSASWATMLRTPTTRFRLMLGMGIMIGSQMTGINAIIYYAPIIFETVGESALLGTAVVGIVNFLSTFIAMWGIDRFGRKLVLLAGSAGMFISFVAIAVLVHVLKLDIDTPMQQNFTTNITYLDNENPDKEVPSAGGILVVAFTTLFVSCFAWSWGPVSWVYVSEVFPLSGRGKLVGVANGSNWVINTLLGYVTPLMLRRDGGMGLVGTFIFYAAFVLIGGIFVVCFCAETKGRSLEEIDSLFDPVRFGFYGWLRRRYGSYRFERL